MLIHPRDQEKYELSADGMDSVVRVRDRCSFLRGGIAESDDAGNVYLRVLKDTGRGTMEGVVLCQYAVF